MLACIIRKRGGHNKALAEVGVESSEGKRVVLRRGTLGKGKNPM